MTNRPLCLASQSVYRRQLLQRLDLQFSQQKPMVDETQLKSLNLHLSAKDLCLFLGKAKGESVHALRNDPRQVTISGDQLVSFQGQILGKTPQHQEAFAQLRLLSGKTHDLLTSVFIFVDGNVHEILNITRLTMRNLTDFEIHRYLDLDEPFDCAGTYKIEAHGISLFSQVTTDDFTAIQGIPLLALHQTLAGILD